MTKIEDLLGIKLSDGRIFTPQNNPSSPTAPIELANVGDTLADIEMIVPPLSDSININDLVAQGKWGDDDGDGQGVNGISALGSISLAITDKYGNTVSRGDALSLCHAPYKVTLSSTGGNLATQYGVPNSSTFSGGTAEYYITLSSQPVICSVRPNLLLGGTSGIDSLDKPRFAGPSNIWSPTKGFLTQSTSPSSYDRNFPTTGLDGLYFDLDIGGIDARQLSWRVNTSGSIGVTVSWRRALTGTFADPRGNVIQADYWITDKSKYVTRVTLTGPKADIAQISSSSPGRITVPSLPQTFELVGRDRSGNEVRYGFKLKQWFVNRGGQSVDLFHQTAWCNSLGYRMPRVRDLTNSNYKNLGAAPSSSGNNYMRHIGAGFFTEWGIMGYYADAGFVSSHYWTSDASGSSLFTVDSGTGYVNSRSASDSRDVLCTAP
ncbi:hypothetical protein A9G27_03125 [Gilliamella sp. Bim3-2]|nr:hypothetical protein A9G32_07105 [Gilliamella apicola]OCG49558.1 hypothetical protein A9G27_03125 [Gilliamella apicola]